MTERRFWIAQPSMATRDVWVCLQDMKPSDMKIAKRIADGWQPGSPIQLEVFHRGKRTNDFLHTGGTFFMVVSERFVTFLEEIGATGWATAPVEIHYKNGEELPGYRLMVTTGRCDRFFAKKKKHSDKPADPSVGWDGSDLFWFEAPSLGFVTTDRIKQAIEEAGLTGFTFEPPLT